MTAATAGTPSADFAAPAPTTTTTTTTPPATTAPPTTSATQVTASLDVPVPSVVGMAADEAASQLSQSGFVVERVDRGKAGTAGVVKSQSPRPGTMASSGASVTIVVAP